MRILIVSQYFWPENFPINDLVLGLVERGHKVTVYTGVPNYPGGRFFEGYGFLKPRREKWHGVKILRAPLIPRGQGGGFRLAVNYLSFALLASLWAPFVCRDRFDIIFVYEPSPVTVVVPALVLKGIKRAPVMLWVQDLWPESLVATGAVRSRAIVRWVDLLVRGLYLGCDRVLVQSRGFIPKIVSQEVKPAHLLYFPNSADGLYQPVEVGRDAPERNAMPHGFCLTFAGNIGAAQDLGTILDAAEKLRGHEDIHWVIIGDGRMHGWLKNQVRMRNLDKTVHLLGRYPQESMPRFFGLSDALLVTLKRDPIFALTIPSKIQAYMACGKPILAALEGEGARVVEESGAGLACKPGDGKGLADAGLALYHMEESERHQMGLKARRYFEHHFEREMLLDRLEKWMKELREKGGACAS